MLKIFIFVVYLDIKDLLKELGLVVIWKDIVIPTLCLLWLESRYGWNKDLNVSYVRVKGFNIIRVNDILD